MRIAVFVSQFPCISETFVISQITGLIDCGHEVDIYATGAAGGELHPDVESYGLLERTRYSRMPSGTLRRAANVVRMLLPRSHSHVGVLLRALNVFRYGRQAASLRLAHEVQAISAAPSYDTILCHFGPNALRGLALRKIGAISGKLVAVFHGYDLTRILHDSGADIYDELFEEGDLFLPISDRWKQKLIDLGCPPSKIIVHRMGVDLSRFEYLPDRVAESDRIGLLTVARLVEKKGVEYGIRAVARLLSEGRAVDYTIVGEGPLRSDLQRLIDELALGHAVRLVGWERQDEIVSRMRQAHVLIAPSVTSSNGDQEGIPVALMEAMASGLPVVSTMHSGIPELVENGASGFLVPERDVAALADRLGVVLDRPEVRKRMAEAARRRVEQEFDVGKLNRRLVELLERIGRVAV